MLKITILMVKLTFKRLKVNDNEANRFCLGGVKKIAKKSRKSKSEKLFKSWKLAKLGKNLSKSRNLLNFDAQKNRLSFLTPKARQL